MINELRLSVLLRGEKFSPKEAEKVTGLNLQDKLEVGAIAPRGRFRGKPVPYGSAQLEVPDNIPYGERLLWIIEVLGKHLSSFYSMGAETTRIYAGYFYKDQCNFGFGKDELQALAKLNIDFDISCYDITEDEEIH